MLILDLTSKKTLKQNSDTSCIAIIYIIYLQKYN